jgi:hypothetical protein
MADKQPPSGIPTIYAEQPYYFGADTFANDLYLQDLEEAMQDREQNYASNVSIGGLYGLAGPGSGAKLAELEAAEKRNKLFKGISADGGFDQSEVDAVTALLDSGAITINDIAIQFDLPPAVLAAAYEANKPLGGTQGAYDAILDASAAIDTGGEYADELNRLNSDIDNKTKEGFGYAKQAAYGVDSLGNELTPAQIAAADLAATAALDTKNTLVDERNTLFESGVEAGIIQTPGFLENLKDTGLEALGDVLGAGTRGIYNVASNIPVVGGYLGDAIEGTADFFKNTEGTLTVNPITGAVQGTWGEIPPWMEKQTVTQIGNIPGSQTTAGVTTGTILDDFISIGRGEQDIRDVLENRTGQVASTIGIDPKILAAATAAGMSVKDYLEAQKSKQTTLAPETGTTTEKETTATIDLSSGPDSDVLNEVLGPQQGVETVTGEEAIDPTSTNQTLTLGDGASPIETVLSGDTVETVLDGEDIVDTLTLGGDGGATTDLDFVFEGPLTAEEEAARVAAAGSGEWENDGAGPEEEVISTRIVGDGLTFEPPVPPEEPPVPPEPPEEPPVPPEPPEEPPVPPKPPKPPEEPPVPPKPPKPPKEPPVPPKPPEPPEPPVLVEEPVVEEEPVEEPVVEEEPVVPEPPLDLSGLFGLRTKPGEKVGAIDFYDIGGESIFQDRDNSEEEEDPLAFLYSNLGDSGIVQDYDIEELIRYLAETRG